MGNIPVPVPHIGSLLVESEKRGRSDVLYFLVLGDDGSITVWTYISDDHAGGWEGAPIQFSEFEQVHINGRSLKRLIQDKFAALP